jgi:hypothetical protein
LPWASGRAIIDGMKRYPKDGILPDESIEGVGDKAPPRSAFEIGEDTPKAPDVRNGERISVPLILVSYLLFVLVAIAVGGFGGALLLALLILPLIILCAIRGDL